MEGEKTLSKITELRDIRVVVQRVAGQPVWRMNITDDKTREVIWFAFGQDIADELVSAITGIQVAKTLPGQ